MLIRIQESEETSVVAESDSNQPFFAGDLRALSVADVLSLLNSGRRTGRIVFELPAETRKTVYLTGGELTFAASNAADDRLGNVLWRAGVITREALQEVAEQVRPGARFGDLLVASGAVTAADLYQGLGRQVRDIVLSLFGYGSGRFLFVAEDNAGVEQVQIQESMRDLILAGLRQVDDLEQLRANVPLGVVYEARPPDSGTELTAYEEAVIAMADGVRTAGEILEASGLGDLEGLRTLHSLAEARLIVPKQAAAAAAARLDAGVEISLSTELEDWDESEDGLDLDWTDDDEAGLGLGGDTGSIPLELAPDSAPESATEAWEDGLAPGSISDLEPEQDEVSLAAEELAGGDLAGGEVGDEEMPADEEVPGHAEEMQPAVDPVADPEPAPEPVVAPKPAPVAAPKPAPVATPKPAPAAAPKPAPVAAPKPAPAPSEHAPTPVAARAPAPRPAQEPAAPADPEAARMPFVAYSKAIGRIYGILKKARKDPESLATYFESAPDAWRPLFEGVRFHDGALDMSRILANARALHGDQYKGRVLEALEAFQSFALFQARNALPAEVAVKLQRLVMLIQLGKA